MTTEKKHGGFYLLRAKVQEQTAKIEQMQADLNVQKAAREAAEDAAKQYREKYAKGERAAVAWEKDCKKAREERDEYKRRIERLHEIVDMHKEREAWILNHAPIARMLYKKHFGV